ncbi:GNAT family N-acetyltransferase [Streptomyces daliensis]
MSDPRTHAADTPAPGPGSAPGPAPVWQVRPERQGEREAVRRVNLAAFETAEEADLVDALREDPEAWLPGLSYVAVSAPGALAGPLGEPVPEPGEGGDGNENGGEVAGFALLTRCHVGDVPALALAPCAVLPAHQGRGAGSAAIRGALDAAREAGERTVIVLGHPAYYPRFGFTPCARFGITPPSGQEWPDEAFLALSLDGGDPPRGPVRYAAPFGI